MAQFRSTNRLAHDMKHQSHQTLAAVLYGRDARWLWKISSFLRLEQFNLNHTLVNALVLQLHCTL